MLIMNLTSGLSHLQDHKFKYKFGYSLNLICNCKTGAEMIAHFLLHWPNISDERLIPMNKIWNIDNNILDLTYSKILKSSYLLHFSLSGQKSRFLRKIQIDCLSGYLLSRRKILGANLSRLRVFDCSRIFDWNFLNIFFAKYFGFSPYKVKFS